MYEESTEEGKTEAALVVLGCLAPSRDAHPVQAILREVLRAKR